MALLSAVDPITINLLITGLNTCWGLAPDEAKGMAGAAGTSGTPGSDLSCCRSAVQCHTRYFTSLSSSFLYDGWPCFSWGCPGHGPRQTLISYALITVAGTEDIVRTQSIPKDVTRMKFHSMTHRTKWGLRDYISPPSQRKSHGKGLHRKVCCPEHATASNLEVVQVTRLKVTRKLIIVA